MNILHIISAAASGGAEVYVKDLAKLLSGEGHTVHIAFLSTAADAGRDMKYEKDFLYDLASANVSTYFIGNETRKKPWLGMMKIRKFILDKKIDVCHAHLAYGVFFTALTCVPVVYTHHTIKPRWGKLMYVLFNCLVDRYVGISEVCAAALREYTGREVVNISNSVSMSKFHGYVRERKLGDAITIAMVGRLAVEKDYMTMVQAVNSLDASIKDRLSVLIAGEGDASYKEELLSRVQEYRLGDVIKFVGVENNIPEFLLGADVFLMSSMTEGLPISLIEATVSGLPCIVTDVGGCGEVIENCKNGIVVPPGDPENLACAISKMVSNGDLVAQYSASAIDNSYFYSIELAARKHVDLYALMAGREDFS